ncbi:MAG: FemAB family XrtA/PEP-CTERM system-associated protein [Vicinamibacterales bacterium]
MATETDRSAWDAYAASHPQASGYHVWSWRHVFVESFGHECVYLIARRAGRTVGILPLVHINSLLFGRTVTSLPFVNYGGVVADSLDEARALVNQAAELARTRRCRYVEFRHTVRRFGDLPCKQHKVVMRMGLSADLWERLDRKVRNQIRKAEKSQLTVSRGKSELLPEFYDVFARNMRDLGTPVYARTFFTEVLKAFPDRTHVLVVRLGDRPVASGLTYRSGDMVEIPWASSVREYNSLCPNHLLYWQALQSAVAEGCTTFDFGRSTPNEGTYKFKEQWGALPMPLHWEYCLLRSEQLPDQSPKNPKFRLAIQIWKRLPLWLTKIIGPFVVRSIP